MALLQFRFCAFAGERLDPRAAIAGVVKRDSPRERDTWKSGMFDKGTWCESQAGWARSVVTGRARLGGIPVGARALLACVIVLLMQVH